MAEQTNPETIPPADPAAFGTDCAVMLRAILPAAMTSGLCPWRVAGLVAQMNGHPGAVLASGNALRWQIAHEIHKALGDAALPFIRRELLIDCDQISGGDHHAR